MREVVILCPTSVERNAAIRVAAKCARIIQTGPGPIRMHAALAQLFPKPPNPETRIILFGVAGALREAPRASLISHIIDREGNRWSVPLHQPTTASPDPSPTPPHPITLLGIDQPITEVPAKSRLAHNFPEAQLIDCESHAFARECARLALDWRIIRGVSDGPTDPLPTNAPAWLTPEGDIRLTAVAASCLARPRTIPHVARLARRTSSALRAAAAILTRIIDENPKRPEPRA